MTGNIDKIFEAKSEYIPTLEEIRSKLTELVGREYVEVPNRKFEDEKGVYLYEVKTIGDSANEENIYIYLRKGDRKECLSGTTRIEVAYYADGKPIGGDTVAEFVDGEWKASSNLKK